jgi:hypothetical protein
MRSNSKTFKNHRFLENTMYFLTKKVIVEYTNINEICTNIIQFYKYLQ